MNKRYSIIIPMAGMGKRLRPQTLLLPKPLFPIAGKPIVEHLVGLIAKHLPKNSIQRITFIIGNFGKAVEERLLAVAQQFQAEGRIVYQKEALGTAHAIYCAKEDLCGEVIIAFADTLFFANFKIDEIKADGVIWAKSVEDPRQYGVLKLDEKGFITSMVEKPDTFVSDLAIIGVYYVKKAELLAEEIRYLLENNIKTKGEYQLTDALARLIAKGIKLVPGTVEEWMDCGNRKMVLNTQRKWLQRFFADHAHISASAKVQNTTIIPPVFIDEGADIQNSVIGPFVSVGKGATINRTILSDVIVRSGASLEAVQLKESIIGEHAEAKGQTNTIDLSDYSRIFL